MKKAHPLTRSLLILLISVNFSLPAWSWSEHPMLIRPALSEVFNWENMDSIEAKSLQTFLMEVEKDMEIFLANHEAWSRANLPNYAPRPDELAFKATSNPGDILERFFTAIRVNPNIKVPLYLHLLPNDDPGERPIADVRDITTLEDIGSLIYTTFVWLNESEPVSPFDVLCTANDEPDHGFDLGLFEDNNTNYGKRYGFGNQPFGNPNLEYSSQAPFHMGFYHEAWIIYKAGPFLKRTHLDYRIHLYKLLSEFAFKRNQPYWGWRFMGWGMHYVGDVSMPYHSKPLPGVSVLRMIWINLKAMLGFPKSRDHAVQLVSNRHTVYEEFQVQVVRKAHEQSDWDHPFIQALKNPKEHIPYSEDFIIEVASEEAVKKSVFIDKALEKYMPHFLVSDPTIEANDTPEIKRIVEVMRAEKGPEAVEQMYLAIAERLESFSMHTRSYMLGIMEAMHGF
jgi:hypothetical protein